MVSPSYKQSNTIVKELPLININLHGCRTETTRMSSQPRSKRSPSACNPSNQLQLETLPPLPKVFVSKPVFNSKGESENVGAGGLKREGSQRPESPGLREKLNALLLFDRGDSMCTGRSRTAPLPPVKSLLKQCEKVCAARARQGLSAACRKKLQSPRLSVRKNKLTSVRPTSVGVAEKRMLHSTNLSNLREIVDTPSSEGPVTPCGSSRPTDSSKSWIWDCDSIHTAGLKPDSEIHLEDLTARAMKHLEEVFKECDKDGSGLIYEEFKDVIQAVIGPNVSQEEMKLMFMKIDTNCDGSVSWTEYVSYLLCELQKKDQMKSAKKDNPLPDELTQKVCSRHHSFICRIRYLPKLMVRQGLSAHRWDYSSGMYVTLSSEGTVTFWTTKLRTTKTFRLQSPRVSPIFATDIALLGNVGMMVASTSQYDLRFYSIASNKSEYSFTVTALPDVCLCLGYWFDPRDMDKSYLFWGDSEGYVHLVQFEACLHGGLFGLLAGVTKVTYQSLVQDQFNADKTTQYKISKLPTKHSDWVRDLNYFPEIESFVSCCQDTNSAMAVTGINGKVKIFRSPKGVVCFDYSKKQNILVTGGIEQAVYGWNPYINSGPIFQLKTCAGCLSLVVNQERNFCINLTVDGNINVFSLRDQTLVQTIPSRSLPKSIGGKTVTTAYFHGHSQSLILAAPYQLAAFVPDLEREWILLTSTHDSPPCSVLYNHLYSVIVTGCVGSSVNVYDIRTGERKLMFDKAHTQTQYNKEVVVEMTTMSFDQSLRRLITGGRDGTIKVWNFHNGDCLKEYSTQQKMEITSLLHVHLRIFATGMDRCVTTFMDMEEAVENTKVWAKKHAEDILSMSFHAPNILATSSYDGNIIIWSTETNRMACRLNAYQSCLPLLEAEDQHLGRTSQRSLIATRYAGVIPHLRKLGMISSLDSEGSSTCREIIKNMSLEANRKGKHQPFARVHGSKSRRRSSGLSSNHSDKEEDSNHMKTELKQVEEENEMSDQSSIPSPELTFSPREPSSTLLGHRQSEKHTDDLALPTIGISLKDTKSQGLLPIPPDIATPTQTPVSQIPGLSARRSSSPMPARSCFLPWQKSTRKLLAIIPRHTKSSVQNPIRCHDCLGLLQRPDSHSFSNELSSYWNKTSYCTCWESCNRGNTTLHNLRKMSNKREQDTSFDASTSITSMGPQKLIKTTAVDSLIFLETRSVSRRTAVLLSSSLDGYIRAWSVHYRGGLLGQFYAPAKPGGNVACMAVDKQNHHLVTGDNFGYIQVWDISDYCLAEENNRTNSKTTEQKKKGKLNMDKLKKKYPYLNSLPIFERLQKKHRYVHKNCPSDQGGDDDSELADDFEELDDENLPEAPPANSEPGRTLNRPLLLSNFQVHTKPLTCLTLADQWEIIITGAEDNNVRVWTYTGRYLGQLGYDTWHRIDQSKAEGWAWPDEYPGFSIPKDVWKVCTAHTMRVLNGGISKRWKLIKNGILRLAGTWFKIGMMKPDPVPNPYPPSYAAPTPQSTGLPNLTLDFDPSKSEYLGNCYKKVGGHKAGPSLQIPYNINNRIEMQPLTPVSDELAQDLIPQVLVDKEMRKRRHLEYLRQRKSGRSSATRSNSQVRGNRRVSQLSMATSADSRLTMGGRSSSCMSSPMNTPTLPNRSYHSYPTDHGDVGDLDSCASHKPRSPSLKYRPSNSNKKKKQVIQFQPNHGLRRISESKESTIAPGTTKQNIPKEVPLETKEVPLETKESSFSFTGTELTMAEFLNDSSMCL